MSEKNIYKIQVGVSNVVFIMLIMIIFFLAVILVNGDAGLKEAFLGFLEGGK